jgi:hypothetical protein
MWRQGLQVMAAACHPVCLGRDAGGAGRGWPIPLAQHFEQARMAGCQRRIGQSIRRFGAWPECDLIHRNTSFVLLPWGQSVTRCYDENQVFFVQEARIYRAAPPQVLKR